MHTARRGCKPKLEAKLAKLGWGSARDSGEAQPMPNVCGPQSRLRVLGSCMWTGGVI